MFFLKLVFYLYGAGFEPESLMLTENDLLKEKDISIDDILAMRLVSIFSLAFQGNQPETANQLKDFINYYKSIRGEYDIR